MYLSGEQQKNVKKRIRNNFIAFVFSLILPFTFPLPAPAADSLTSQILAENPDLNPVFQNPELIFNYIKTHKGEKVKVVTENSEEGRELPDLIGAKEEMLTVLKDSWGNLVFIAVLWGVGKRREKKRENQSNDPPDNNQQNKSP